MKIIFDLRSVGLGNNGGSSTLVKSANTLVKMGHTVFFVDHMKNQHTWTPLKAKHKIVKRDQEKLPTADIIVATGYKSVNHTLRAPKRCGIKAHWIRGWETWQMNEKAIVNQILKAPTVKFVNGLCLQDRLNDYGFDSHLVRPGYDFDVLYPTDARLERDKFVIGALHTTGKHVGIKRYGWILEIAKYMKKKYTNVELWMMGTAGAPKQADKYYRQPKPDKKNEFYNGVDLWLSPSKQEGLHMPPAEAMMTGCPVVGTDAPLSGTKDYLINEYSGLVSKDDYHDFRYCVEKLYKNRVLRYSYGHNALQAVRDIGTREENMQNFVEIIEGIK